jgi:hypothetical protein
MILFEGDFVRPVNETTWLRIEEIIFNDADPMNNKLRMSDGWMCPQPFESHLADVRSASEHIVAIAAEVRAKEERA